MTPVSPTPRSDADDVRPFIEALQRLLAAPASPAGAAAAAQAFTEFLRDHYAAAGPAWRDPVFSFIGTAKPADPPNHPPAMGPARQYQERAQRLADAALRYDAAQRRLLRLWSDLLSEAATTFADRVLAMNPAQPTQSELHDLFDLWIDSAEQAYSRAAAGESFCDAVADSVNAISDWRRDMQANIEDSAKVFDLPTRSELDGLAKRLRALESEIHLLRAQQPLPRKTPRRRRARPDSKR